MTPQEMVVRFRAAQAEEAALIASVAPTQAKLDAASADMEAARHKFKAAKTELIPQLLRAEISALRQEIAMLARAVGGHALMREQA